MDPTDLSSLDTLSDGLNIDPSAAGVTSNLPGFGYADTPSTAATPLAVSVGGDGSTLADGLDLSPGVTDGFDASTGTLSPSLDTITAGSELAASAATAAQQAAATAQLKALQNSALGLTSGGYVSSSSDTTILLIVAVVAAFLLLKQ